ncbi:hypothetical protein NDU88_003133 [Pleurodeles waltl]|uniref:Uncharacterized protein n=1 Tax=Pleurodeles waltl TaxID=8319 RepID=A0AAV7UCW4_PLEWA|nr:hypothetical protein NDU88_003133 [Pleurodeles waltl]
MVARAAPRGQEETVEGSRARRSYYHTVMGCCQQQTRLRRRRGLTLPLTTRKGKVRWPIPYDFRGPRGSGMDFVPFWRYKEGSPRQKEEEKKETKETKEQKETKEPKEACINARTTGSQAESRSCRTMPSRDPRLRQRRGRCPARFPATLQEKRGYSRCAPLVGRRKTGVIGREEHIGTRKASEKADNLKARTDRDREKPTEGS